MLKSTMVKKTQETLFFFSFSILRFVYFKEYFNRNRIYFIKHCEVKFVC